MAAFVIKVEPSLVMIENPLAPGDASQKTFDSRHNSVDGRHITVFPLRQC